MRASQPSTWTFPLDRGIALPRDREHFPDAFEIPHGCVSLFPVKTGDSLHYLAYQPGKSRPDYHLCPRVGASRRTDPEQTDQELLEGLLIALPGRVNAQTLFSRIQIMPPHLHMPGIECIASKKFTGLYVDHMDLKRALSAMNESMGHHVQRAISVCQMAHELGALPAEARGKASLLMRKRFPEPWVDEAQKKCVRDSQKTIKKPGSSAEIFDFGL